MPAIASLLLLNRAGTPADVTFDPVRIEGNISYFRAPGATALGDKTMSVSARTTAGGYRKVVHKFVVPVVSTDTSTGVDLVSVVRKAHCSMEFTFAPDATEDEMNEIIAYARDSLSEDQTILDPVLTLREAMY